VGVVGEWNAPGKVLVSDTSQASGLLAGLLVYCQFTPAAGLESGLLVGKFASKSAQTERTHRQLAGVAVVRDEDRMGLDSTSRILVE